MNENKKIDEKQLEEVAGGRVQPFEKPVRETDATPYTCPNCGAIMYDQNLYGGTFVKCNICGKTYDVQGGVITEVK